MQRAFKRDPLSVGGPGFTALFGLALAAAGIVTGLVLEGGHVADVCQISAAIIVFGGTIGALLLTAPPAALRSAAGNLKAAFLAPEPCSLPERSEKILAYAYQAYRKGILSLEEAIAEIDDPFFRKALTLAIDGAEPETIRRMMELEMNQQAAAGDADAAIFESAGGYAPTLGIVGAVIGLIQVMRHFDNLSQVGSGIAVAFVATIYGVGAANLLFLPIAQRIRFLSERSYRLNQLTIEGVITIAQKLNPRMTRLQTQAFLPAAGSVARPATIPLRAPAAVRAAS